MNPRDKFSVNLWATHLRLMDAGFILRSAERVLDVLSEGVRECGMEMERAEESGNEEFLDAVVDEGCDVIEHLLGAAFVVCQACIGRVVSRVMHAMEKAGKKAKEQGKTLLTPTTKSALMKFGCREVGKCGVSAVQAIDAFANYFKHSSEWRTMDWTKITDKRQRPTIDAITALGASSGSTGNLRTAAEVLGNSTYGEMRIFLAIVDEWRADVQKSLADDLVRVGVIDNGGASGS